MSARSRTVLKGVVALTLLAMTLLGQRGGNPNEWATAYGDAQRSSWNRTTNISTESLRRPGFALQWKAKLDTPAGQRVALTQGIVATGVNIFTPLSIVAGPANLVSAFDNDTGNVFWSRRIEVAVPPASSGCSGEITGAPTRLVTLTSSPAASPRGGGRGARYFSSAVGEPAQGIPLPQSSRTSAAAIRAPVAPASTPAPTPAAPAPPSPFPTNPAAVALASRGGGTLFRPSPIAYLISGDGTLHKLGLVSGKDVQQPISFVPPGVQFSDLIAVGDMIYTATSRGCGSAPSGIWAIDVSGGANTIKSWNTNGGNPLGSIAFSTSGTLIAAVGAGAVKSGGYANAIVALDAKSLTIKDWFMQPGVELTSAPLLFGDNGRELAAVTTKDGRVLLLDAASLGGDDHATALLTSVALLGETRFAGHPAATSVNGTTRWMLLPITGSLRSLPGAQRNGLVTSGAVLALKVKEEGGKFSAEPAWVSENFAAPLTPIVVNDVVFVVSSAPNASAKLYALDGATGRTLWQSGNAMTAPVSGQSFWAGSGQVYVGTTDGTIYAFGFDMGRGPTNQRSGS
ncbi:MAG: PQQ-binding-like beta-propeller repeat protein [Bryobacteraceae bacterium]